MKTLTPTDLTAVYGGSGMCGELGIDTGESCMVFGKTDWFTGQQGYISNIWTAGDNFGMNLNADGTKASLSVSIDGNGNADLKVTKGNMVIGGACVPIDTYTYR